MTFSKAELKKFSTQRLVQLARYLDVPIPSSIRRDEFINEILNVLYPPEPELPKINYLEGETPENPLYSVRIRRIMEARQKGEL